MNPIPMNSHDRAKPIGKGCRVSLLYTADSSTKLRNSDRGIVTGTWKDSRGVLNIDVDWDIGEKLTLSTDKDCFEYFWPLPGYEEEPDTYRTKKVRPRRSKAEEEYYAIESKASSNANPYYGFYLHVKRIIEHEGTKKWRYDDSSRVSRIRNMLEKYDARSKK